MLVDPPSISDHSLITVGLLPSHVILPADIAVIRRQWSHFDEVAFAKDLGKSRLLTDPPTARDLGESRLLTDPPTACNEMFVCYDETLSKLMNKHAPLKKFTRRNRTTAPWFNSVCYQAKVKARRLEQIYWSKNTVIACREWRSQRDGQRRVFQIAYSDY